MLKTVYNSFLAVVYPQQCRICENSVETAFDGVACRECWDKVRLPGGNEAVCIKCGAYFGQAAKDSVDCPQCVDHSYGRATAAGAYEFALAATVIGLKSRPHIARRGRELFRDAAIKAAMDRETLIVPVPLSEKRHLERGFNQAEVLARIAAAAIGAKMRTDILSRKVHTPMHRAAMDQKARALSVKNAFDVTGKTSLTGASILLVDDVLTSGATVSNCAKILKKHGASQVDVLTLARAV